MYSLSNVAEEVRLYKLKKILENESTDLLGNLINKEELKKVIEDQDYEVVSVE